MVPVLDKNNVALMPCSEKRARRLMEKKQAKPYWQKGVFCIKLLKEPSDRKYQNVALGIDPGSKREGYTVATEKSVVLNITTNTPDWIKSHVETRRNLRRARRQRKTPYRKCRSNRSRKAFLPPSTKARWDCKLRMIQHLTSILPITKINIEDIAAKTKPGAKKWNQSFSPLEVGKMYFEKQIAVKYPHIELTKTKGFNTKEHRDSRGFVKSKSKLEYKWECHNVDSHSLCEMVLKKNINPYYGMYKIEYLQYYRRQLHVQIPQKGGIRKQYGGTVSLGISRGTVIRYKGKLSYVGGTSKGRLSIHSILTGKRLAQNINKKDITIMYNTKRRVAFISQIK